MSYTLKEIEQNYDLGRKLIANAISIDEALIEILRLQMKKSKKEIGIEYEKDSIDNLTKTLRSVITILILTEEKIKVGMTLCNINDNEEFK